MYNVNGQSIPYAYDIDGEQIGGATEQQKYIYTDVTDNICTSSLQSNLSTAYAEMIEMDATNPILVGVSTDQHGRNIKSLQYLHNIDDHGMAKINLGDTVTDYYNVSQAESLRLASKRISRYVGVVGNHDAFTHGSDVATNEAVTEAFTCSYANVSRGEIDYYSADDADMGVRFLVLNPYYMESDGSRNGATIREAQMEFIVNQLTSSQHDVIVLMHQLLFRQDSGVGNDSTQTMLSIRQMLIDYNNRQSGTITDDDGVTHAYDFRSASHKVLCTLHGHWHSEEYETDGLFSYATEMYGDEGTTTLMLIDRDTMTCHVWVCRANGIERKQFALSA